MRPAHPLPVEGEEHPGILVLVLGSHHATEGKRIIPNVALEVPGQTSKEEKNKGMEKRRVEDGGMVRSVRMGAPKSEGGQLIDPWAAAARRTREMASAGIGKSCH